MKVDKLSINNLVLIIVGETKKQTTPNKSGRELVAFFNEFGFRDVYDYKNGGLPNKLSRKAYTEDRLKKINGTKNMEKLILALVDENRYFDTEYNVDEIAYEINTIIKANNFKLEKLNDNYIMIGETIADESIEVEPRFEDIQEMIIEEIRKAKYTIWISVAWFTDKLLFDELIKKKSEGVNIQLIISNDNTNRKYGFNFEQYFETYRINPYGVYDSNILHNKFCVIDLETVLQGSYNWTNMAQYHKEQLERVKSRENAVKYADRFIELKLEK